MLTLTKIETLNVVWIIRIIISTSRAPLGNKGRGTRAPFFLSQFSVQLPSLSAVLGWNEKFFVFTEFSNIIIQGSQNSYLSRVNKDFSFKIHIFYSCNFCLLLLYLKSMHLSQTMIPIQLDIYLFCLTRCSVTRACSMVAVGVTSHKFQSPSMSYSTALLTSSYLSSSCSMPTHTYAQHSGGKQNKF